MLASADVETLRERLAGLPPGLPSEVAGALELARAEIAHAHGHVDVALQQVGIVNRASLHVRLPERATPALSREEFEEIAILLAGDEEEAVEAAREAEAAAEQAREAIERARAALGGEERA